jgi:HPt (histidine-containing phosphotransfer) domain-containing protein
MAENMLEKLIKRITRLLGREHATAGETAPETERLHALPEDDLHLEQLSRQFSQELFAKLLVELPAHRTIMAEAHTEGNDRRLRDAVHQILGAAAYCDAPELETGLRELRLALKTGDRATIDHYYERAISEIDRTLKFSGLCQR